MKRSVNKIRGVFSEVSVPSASRRRTSTSSALEEIQRMKNNFKESTTQVRGGVTAFNEAVSKIDKHSDVFPRKRLRTQSQVSTSCLENGAQKLEEKATSAVPNKRKRSNGIVRPFVPVDGDKVGSEHVNGGSTLPDDKGRSVRTCGDDWEMSLVKKKRSVIKSEDSGTVVLGRSFKGNREPTQGMQQKLTSHAHQRVDSHRTHGLRFFREGPVPALTGVGKSDSMTQQNDIRKRPFSRNDQDNGSLLINRRDFPVVSHKGAAGSKASNRKPGRPPTKNKSERKGDALSRQSMDNTPTEFAGELGHANEELLAAAKTVLDTSTACSSSFWKQSEPHLGILSAQDRESLNQRMDPQSTLLPWAPTPASREDCNTVSKEGCLDVCGEEPFVEHSVRKTGAPNPVSICQALLSAIINEEEVGRFDYANGIGEENACNDAHENGQAFGQIFLDRNFECISMLAKFEYNPIDIEDKILLELSKIGLCPEPVPDLALRREREIGKDISMLKENFHELVSSHPNASDSMDGNEEAAKDGAPDFVRRTSTQCQQFVETGSSCFNGETSNRLASPLLPKLTSTDTDSTDDSMEAPPSLESLLSRVPRRKRSARKRHDEGGKRDTTQFDAECVREYKANPKQVVAQLSASFNGLLSKLVAESQEINDGEAIDLSNMELPGLNGDLGDHGQFDIDSWLNIELERFQDHDFTHGLHVPMDDIALLNLF